MTPRAKKIIQAALDDLVTHIQRVDEELHRTSDLSPDESVRVYIGPERSNAWVGAAVIEVNEEVEGFR
jgi:hypothetical protein